MPAQDPDEPFDLYAEDGAPLGRTKARARVHRDGDWHRSLHLWVVLGPSPGAARGDAIVVFQRRSAQKDTWPRALDVAVTGHYRAGESLAEALREAEEEIGLAVAPADVVRLEVRRRASRPGPGLVDNELQDIVVTRSGVAFADLAPSPDELEGVVALSIADALRLHRGEIGAAAATLLPHVGAAPVAAEVTLAEFVPAPDGYYVRTLEAIEAAQSGRRSVP